MKKKSLIMVACALLVISSMAFGTIAYLTDRAGVTNKFTIGNVNIIVDETKVDENGDPVPNPDQDPENPDDDNKRTEEGNEYPLIPGSKYAKDPRMTVKAGSEESYVRMMVTINKAKELLQIFEELKAYPQYANGFVPNEHVEGWDNAVWTYQGYENDSEENTITLEFRYPATVTPTDTEDEVLPPLFKELKIPGELTNKHLAMLGEDFSIEVNGNAIQTKGFESADAAWAAFDTQMNVTGE